MRQHLLKSFNQISFLCLTAVLLFASCSKEGYSHIEITDRLQVGLATVSSTRASIVEGTTLPYESRFGIFALNSNTLDTLDNGYNAPVKYVGDECKTDNIVLLPKDADVMVYAYYPYNYNSHSVDIRSADRLWIYTPEQEDVLVGKSVDASGKTAYARAGTNPKVNISFQHALSRIHLTFRKGADCKENVYCKEFKLDGSSLVGQYLFSESRIFTLNEHGSLTSYPSGNVELKDKNDVIEVDFLIIPHSSADYEKSPLSVRMLTSDGKNPVAALPNIGYESGQRYNFTVTVNDGYHLEITANTIVDWNHPSTLNEISIGGGIENGHKYVDLGLSVMWATCNIGAEDSLGDGDSFAWGEIEAKNSFTEDNYYYKENPVLLPLDRDAARVNWGGRWRMPTYCEIQELINNCTIETVNNGNTSLIDGIDNILEGKNGEKIYLPSSFWSSSLCLKDQKSSAYDYVVTTLVIAGGPNIKRLNNTIEVYERYKGLHVRPVFEPDNYVSVTDVKLNTASLTLEVGEDSTLIETVSPSIATNKNVRWYSSDTDIATVDDSGKVRAKAIGITTITVYTDNGGKYASCTVIVTEVHEWVDLGLSVKWATMNVGASKPEDYGDYFAWAETTPKGNYDWTNLKYRTSGYITDNVKFSKYVTNSNYGTVDNRTTLELSDDAAHANWGGSWRMPTRAEQDELRENCTWTKTTHNGVTGYEVTSMKPGYTSNSIFLPAAGYRQSSNLYSAGSHGSYWSSSLGSGGSYTAYELGLGSGFGSGIDWYDSDRLNGNSVRPVCP